MVLVKCLMCEKESFDPAIGKCENCDAGRMTPEEAEEAKKIMPDEEVIQFIGVHDLDTSEQLEVNKLATEYYEKLKRQIKNILGLKVHIKTHENEGNRKKFSIHLQTRSPTFTFESTKAADFELAKALHKAFQDLEHQIQHQKHSDDQKPRTREPQE